MVILYTHTLVFPIQMSLNIFNTRTNICVAVSLIHNKSIFFVSICEQLEQLSTLKRIFVIDSHMDKEEFDK